MTRTVIEGCVIGAGFSDGQDIVDAGVSAGTGLADGGGDVDVFEQVTEGEMTDADFE